MFLQLIVIGPAAQGSSYGSWIVLFFLAAGFFVDLLRRKVNRAWLLRPSSILILLGACFCIYMGLYNPWWVDWRYGALIIPCAFVIRQWEDEAVREVEELDSDKGKDQDDSRKE